jgi:hypothetical protein
VGSSTSAGPHADLAGWQVEIIVDHQRALGRYFVESHRFTHTFPGQVHVGGGLEQDDFPASDGALASQAFEADFIKWDLVTLAQNLQHQIATIVPGLSYWRPGLPSPATSQSSCSIR